MKKVQMLIILIVFALSSNLNVFGAINYEEKVDNVVNEYIGEHVTGLQVAIIEDGEIVLNKEAMGTKI